jgi:isoquinoline 1-oxidoreductase beta subunit
VTRRPVNTLKPIARRKFLVTAAAGSGGFLLGFRLPSRAWAASDDATARPARDIPFNAWIRISTDDVVTILLSQSEMGQGVYTSFPMLIADELGADWEKIRVEAAPADRAYINTLNEREFFGAPITEQPDGVLDTVWDWVVGGITNSFGRQFTGGSTSIRFWAMTLREAGAAVREMLLTVAAEKWDVPIDECVVDRGVVFHAASEQALSFGELAEDAAELEPPDHPRIKTRDELVLIGRPVPRLDIPMKVNGSAEFGIDVKVPDMLYGAPRTCPVFGGTVKNYDGDAISRMPGVVKIIDVPNGVVVVADSTWRAQKASDALPIVFDKGAGAGASSRGIMEHFRSLEADESGVVDREDGDVEAAFAESAKIIDGEYSVPFLAHACLEPINCTARVTSDECELWVPTQAQEKVQIAAAEVAGVSKSDVSVNTTFLGGGFGRRSEADMVVQAVLAAKAVGRPVKVTWSREQDTRHDFYRPAVFGRLRTSLDSNGVVTGWRHRIVSPSILKRSMPFITYLGHDVTSVEGAANLPYNIPNQLVEYVMADTPVPVGFWRSVGSTQNAFITESFIDEMAYAGERDPYAFRRVLLADAPRFRAVLDLAAEKASWGSKLPEGWGRGIAIHKCFGSIAAQVADVQVTKAGGVKIHHVVCAIDCGEVVNSDTVVAQMEGGIIFGLTAAMYGEMTIEDGRAVEGNFGAYRMALLSDAPEIETFIIEGGLPLGGVGEPGTPPIAPAITNAIFAATGRRIRDLPIQNHDLSA